MSEISVLRDDVHSLSTQWYDHTVALYNIQYLNGETVKCSETAICQSPAMPC